MKHSLRAFRHRNYRLFFSGQSISVIGTWIQQLAMSWLVYRMTGSAWLLGVTAFAGQISILVFAPFGGIWADRFDRRTLLIATQAFAMLQGLALAALTYSGLVEVWHIVVMALLLGTVMAIDMPIRQSFTTEMVPDREDLPSAIAFNGFMQNAGRMIGPTIAGMLLAVSSEAFCFLLNGVSKIAVLAGIFMMSIAPRERPAQEIRAWESLREGIRYAREVVPIRVLLPVLALTSFMLNPYQSLMPIFAGDVFAGGADTLGFLIGAAGLGGIAALIFIASRASVRGLARWVAVAPALAGAAIIGFAYSRSLPLSLMLIAVTGFGLILTANSTLQILQTIVDDAMRGRVMSFFGMAFLGMAPLGSLAAGGLASWIGATHTLAFGGFCCILGAFALWRQLPALREEMRHIYARLGVGRKPPQE